MAQSAMRLAEGNLNHARENWHEAEAARSDNKLYYRLSRTHGHGYHQEREKALCRAHKEYNDAQERLEKAKADYQRVTGKDPV